MVKFVQVWILSVIKSQFLLLTQRYCKAVGFKKKEKDPAGSGEGSWDVLPAAWVSRESTPGSFSARA